MDPENESRGNVTVNVCVISGADEIRLRSYVNHTIYCREYGLDYRVECLLTPDVEDKFLLKWAAVARQLPKYDWVAWLDDDCYITDFSRDLFREHALRANLENKTFVISRGVEEPQGLWSYVNSGVFMVKNSPEGAALVQSVLDADPEEVTKWWDPVRYGMFTSGHDQDLLTWALVDGGFEASTLWVDHRELNSRYHYYRTSLNEAFICHFCGFPDKKMGVVAFANHFEIGHELVPSNLLDKFHASVRSPMSHLEQQARLSRWRWRGRLKPYLKPLRDHYRSLTNSSPR